ncbi:hypothetical protein ILYODFUR_030298 [Ilyodon furcidens]|uniref:Uncharacterized protein n=1 Tax=Ilyodon furcidens TaxID=33524 RepID=A0ABV0TZB8_9TELE
MTAITEGELYGHRASFTQRRNYRCSTLDHQGAVKASSGNCCASHQRKTDDVSSWPAQIRLERETGENCVEFYEMA